MTNFIISNIKRGYNIIEKIIDKNKKREKDDNYLLEDKIHGR